MKNQAKKELWVERIRSFEISGLSRRAWCQEQGLPEHQLGYWIRKLRSRTLQPENKRWVSMQADSAYDAGISIKIGGITLTVQHGFDHQLLTEVVRTLITVC